MIKDIEKIGKAKEIIQKIANGIDPINGGEISNDHILNDPRMIRMFFFVSEVLDNVVKGEYSKDTKLADFIITQEQKEDWDNIKEFLCDAMIRLDGALREPLKKAAMKI